MGKFGRFVDVLLGIGRSDLLPELGFDGNARWRLGTDI